MKGIALVLIRFYQNVISPITPPSCRYQPTCSQYGYEAFSKYGFFKGGWMTAKRIMRCHPFAKGGVDPVP
ncbi:MAG: membrane protein insertion efficiency factor YidD [Dehalococcoidia bacterium]